MKPSAKRGTGGTERNKENMQAEKGCGLRERKAKILKKSITADCAKSRGSEEGSWPLRFLPPRSQRAAVPGQKVRHPQGSGGAAGKFTEEQTGAESDADESSDNESAGNKPAEKEPAGDESPASSFRPPNPHGPRGLVHRRTTTSCQTAGSMYIPGMSSPVLGKRSCAWPGMRFTRFTGENSPARICRSILSRRTGTRERQPPRTLTLVF